MSIIQIKTSSLDNKINHLIIEELSDKILSNLSYRQNLINNSSRYYDTIIFLNSAISYYESTEEYYKCADLLNFKKLLQEKICKTLAKSEL